MSQVIGNIGDPRTKQVRVSIEEYKGIQGVDIREWYQGHKDMMPTSKGIRIPINQISQVITFLEQAEQSLVKSGQLKLNK